MDRLQSSADKPISAQKSALAGARLLARARLSNCSHEPWVPLHPQRPQFFLSNLAWASACLLMCTFLTYVAGVHSHWILKWAPCASFCAVLAFCCVVLEPVSYDKLLEAEAALLATVRSDVQHRWTVRQSCYAATITRVGRSSTRPPHQFADCISCLSTASAEIYHAARNMADPLSADA